jgi:type II secretory pathway predicted ATPase ExeA/uncharacterized phage infection (PIP) family protein YhgE
VYRSFFKLREDPFDNCPDPRFFYNSPAHEEALASVHHVATHRKGAILLTGLPGVGKTLVGRLAVRSLGSEVRAVWLRDPLLSAKELLVEICRGFNLDVDSEAGQVDLMAQLERYLIAQFRNDVIVCLVVDDVQDFSSEAFRLFKTLNNMEVDDAKLVQLILLGHSARQACAVSRLSNEFRDRLYRVLELPALDQAETGAYLSHRLKLAGDDCDVSFTTEAVAGIYRVSRGVPRAVNKIAEFALLAAYAESAHIIGTEILERALEENHLEPDAPEEPFPYEDAGERDAETTDAPVPSADQPEPQPMLPARSETLGDEIKHVRMITRGLRSRRERLQEAVTEAGSTLEHLQDANATSHQNLTRLENALEQMRLMTEAARTAETSLRSERDRIEEQVERRLAAVTDHVESMLHKLEGRLQECDNLQQRARRASTDARDRIAMLEQAHQHTAGAAASLEELHARIRSAADTYRSLQARLDASQDRINHVLATSQEHLARFDQSESDLAKHLDTARNAIAALAKVGSVEKRLTELLKTARGGHASLAETHQRVQQTLQESEDHFSELAQALERGRQYAAEVEQAKNIAREERKAAEQARHQAQALLEDLGQREARLQEGIAQINEHLNAVQQANLQAKNLVAASRASVDELSKTCAQTVETTHEAAENAEARLFAVREQLDKTTRKAEASLAGVKTQLDEAALQTVSGAERLLAERHQQLLSATSDAAAEAEGKLERLREQFKITAATAEGRLEELRTQLAEAADRTIADTNRRLTARQRQLLDLTNEAATQAGDHLAEVSKQFEAAASDAEGRVEQVKNQIADATNRAVERGEEKLAESLNRIETVASDAQQRMEETRTGLIEAANQVTEDFDLRLADRRRHLLDTAEATTADAEQRLASARDQFDAVAAAAEKRVAETSERLTDAAGETLSKVEHRLAGARREIAEATHEAIQQTNARLDETTRQFSDIAVQADERLGRLESANLAAAQNADSARRLLRELDDAHQRNLVLQRDAQRTHAELFEQNNRASETLSRMDESLPKLQETQKRIEDLLLQTDRRIDQLHDAYRQTDAFTKKTARFLDELRDWKQELIHDRNRAAKIIKRSRQHLSIVLEAESRARHVVSLADERTEKFEATLGRADQLLVDTGHRLTRMLEAHDKTEKLIAKGFKQLLVNQEKADAILVAVEEKRVAARQAIVNLEAAISTARDVIKMQNHAGDKFHKQTRRLAGNLCIQQEKAQKLLQALQTSLAESEQAVRQPRALLDEALQHVPQLQKLCKLLHEIYFKLHTHVPDMITPRDWEKMADSAEGATRQLLIANTARIRQLVDVGRRLYEKTAERIVHLQTENERASALCRMLPLRTEQTLSSLSQPSRVQKQLQHALGRISETTKSPQAPAGALGNTLFYGESGFTPTAPTESPRRFKIADLATNVAGVTSAMETTARPDRGTGKSGLPRTQLAEHPLAQEILNS